MKSKPTRYQSGHAEVSKLLTRAEQQYQNGNLATASKHLRKALKINATEIRALLLLARIQQQQNDIAAALDSYSKALKHHPDSVEALINIGMIYKRSGRLDAAIESYQKALTLRDDIPQLHNNLGNAWLDKGEHERAETAYQTAVSRQPDFAGGWHNLGRLYLQQGLAGQALAPLRQAQQLQPDDRQTVSDLADCLTQLPPAMLDAEFGTDLLACLQLQRIDGRALNRTACRYLREVQMTDLMTQTGTAQYPDLDQLQNPVLLTLLRREPICDWPLEQFLCRVRRLMLNRAADLTDAYLPLLAALAEQCFLNEYIWQTTADEALQIDELETRLRCRQGDDSLYTELCLYACYRPLNHVIEWQQAEANLSRYPESVAALLRQQVIDPAIETDIKSRLPVWTEIAHGTSASVRGQYEINPYPRWRMLDQPAHHTLSDYLCRLFPGLRQEPPRFAETPEILCAGAGTGLQALRMARRIPAARVTAIDMSQASLAYGQREATARGLETVRFAQADILNLSSDIGLFDCIECYGVLHHLADPFAGWQALRQLLKPGGVMRIGLYSHQARGPIRRIRELIEKDGINADIEGIRRIRERVANAPADDPIHGLIHSPDFYSVSECRDLMFHVQEHQLDLATIADMLETLELRFLGFEFDDYRTLNAYQADYPDDPTGVDLRNWQAFETRYPDSFAAQYIFWVRSCR